MTIADGISGVVDQVLAGRHATKGAEGQAGAQQQRQPGARAAGLPRMPDREDQRQEHHAILDELSWPHRAHDGPQRHRAARRPAGGKRS
jgi:hypothetical protein